MFAVIIAGVVGNLAVWAGLYLYGVHVGMKSQREAVEEAYERGRDDAVSAVIYG